ncbi:MAG: SEC-C domain-containing protein [Chloroflexi bacterium]|nr:SEC-C domain-containing protein [Chloroflexota bacterium]
MTVNIPTVLDSRQLKRIESEHGGFLYQHLYAAACLMTAQASGAVALLVERDEDIEILFADHQLYIQVKTRSAPLMPNDIEATLTRFASLRAEHASGRRNNPPKFCVVTNAVPGPKLKSLLAGVNWPADVDIVWPGNTTRFAHNLPPAWTDLVEAFHWCTDQATTIPFTLLSPETLVLKLAGKILIACTASSPHELHQFYSNDFQKLFEQVVVQLQGFPSPPTVYRPTDADPSFENDKRARLIMGLSGAGKTAWASQFGAQTGKAVAYFDITDTPGGALASALTQELAARFLGKVEEGLRSVLLPGRTGIDALRALDIALENNNLQVTLVLDNVHKVPPSGIQSIVQATPNVRYIMLAQPWPGQVELEALLNIQTERLRGWSLDTIAQVFAEAGCLIDPATTARVLRITGGLPLFIQNSAEIAKRSYQRQADLFCNDIDAQTNIAETAQEKILGRVFDTVGKGTKDAAALFGVASVPLVSDEACRLLVGIERPRALHMLRELTGLGIIQLLRNRKLIMHDAFRPVASAHRMTLDSATVRQARLELKAILTPTQGGAFDVIRFGAFLGLLYDLGDVEELVDIASYEHIFELGYDVQVTKMLEEIASSSTTSPRDRFWALDTLTFWDLQIGNLQSVEARLVRLGALLQLFDAGTREQTNVLMKQMALSGEKGHVAEIRQRFAQASAIIQHEPSFLRALRYNFARALYKARVYEEADAEGFRLILEYYDVLGLTPEDVIAKNVPEIKSKLVETRTLQDDLKRLADTLDLHAKIKTALGQRSVLSRIHSMKFYDLAGAPTSVVRVGQDVVDELLEVWTDPLQAKDFIERTLLPTMQHFQLLGYTVRVRSQYAVILAYCGDIDRARKEIGQLEPYKQALPALERRELENQRQLIEKIARGEVQFRAELPLATSAPSSATQMPSSSKIGRNDPCPCGSGKKYKRCHGMNRT